MFIHNIDPVLARAFGLEIRYYGLVYAFGFLFALWYLLRLSKAGRLKLSEEEVYDYMMYLIIGSIVTSRLFEVLFYHPIYYLSNPLEILMMWKGGLSFHGGLIGAAAATMLFIRKRKIGFYELADPLIIPFSFCLFLGRFANFLNAELYGKVTTLPWGVKFPGAEGYRHPSQIYESLKNLAIFTYLSWLCRKKWKKGFIFWNFVTFYGLLRFIIEFWKEPETAIFGAPVGQLMSLLMLAVGSYVIVRYYSKK